MSKFRRVQLFIFQTLLILLKPTALLKSKIRISISYHRHVSDCPVKYILILCFDNFIAIPILWTTSSFLAPCHMASAEQFPEVNIISFETNHRDWVLDCQYNRLLAESRFLIAANILKMNQSVDSSWGVLKSMSAPNGGWTSKYWNYHRNRVQPPEVVFVKHGFNFLWLKYGWSSVCCICTNVQTTDRCANGSVPPDRSSSSSMEGRNLK